MLLNWPVIISPQKLLPNLSTDGQENAIFGTKNTNPHTPISKPAHYCITHQFRYGERLGLDERLRLGHVRAEQRLELLRVNFGEEVLIYNAKCEFGIWFDP